jgi:ADP-ribose pyrophosphatase YjhB (NUDIX family)
MITAALASNPVQRKVAIFVVRNASTAAEVAVFWHPGGGLQVPAGTVEPGESFEQAAIREAIEETGLVDVTLVGDLGSQESIMGDGRALLLEEVNLRLSPGGPQTRWRLSRAAVEVIELRGEWAMVRMQERDLDNPDLLVAQLTGWVPVKILTRRQERRFYLASSTDTKIDSWQHQGEPEHSFTVSWQPVRPRPKLVEGQDAWLDRLDAGLRDGR